MTPSSISESLPRPSPPFKLSLAAVLRNITDDRDHPLQIALRTYSLCLSLSLGPVLLPAIFALAIHPNSFTARVSVIWLVLSRELRPTGFASAITIAVGGGAALQRFWNFLVCRHTHRQAWVHHINSKLSLCQRAFLANVISSTLAVILLRRIRFRRMGGVSPTLDLNLLLLVRALDASVQALLLQKGREIAVQQAPRPSTVSFTPPDTRMIDKQTKDLAKEWQDKAAIHLDAFVFWASSARFVTMHTTVSMVFLGSFILLSKDHVVLLLSTSEVCYFYLARSWLV